MVTPSIQGSVFTSVETILTGTILGEGRQPSPVTYSVPTSSPSQLLKSNVVSFLEHNPPVPQSALVLFAGRQIEASVFQQSERLRVPSDECTTMSTHLSAHNQHGTRPDGHVFHMFETDSLSNAGFQESFLCREPHLRHSVCIFFHEMGAEIIRKR